MKSYLISVPIGDPAPAGVRHSAHTQDYNNGTEMRSLWDCINASDPTPGNGYLIGSWDMGGGDLLSPVHADFFLGDVRPLGNAPEQVIYNEDGNPSDVIPAGLATPSLRYAYWDTPGMAERKLDPGGNLYPNDNPPFRCECRLLENVVYGWYPRWEITMESGAEIGRDPSVRNVRVFADPDCTQFRYTTGAFIYGDSIWHTDEEGNPAKCWWASAQQFVQAGTPVYFSIYWGETPNGRFEVKDQTDIADQLFWELDQPPRNGNQLARSIVSSTGVKPTSKDNITKDHRHGIRDAAIAAGIPPNEWNNCDALNGPNVEMSYKEAFLRIMRCINRGEITLP